MKQYCDSVKLVDFSKRLPYKSDHLLFSFDSHLVSVNFISLSLCLIQHATSDLPAWYLSRSLFVLWMKMVTESLVALQRFGERKTSGVNLKERSRMEHWVLLDFSQLRLMSRGAFIISQSSEDKVEVEIINQKSLSGLLITSDKSVARPKRACVCGPIESVFI